MAELERPLVSIVIAVYNIEDYVDRCLMSAINQNYEMTEIIVVDDGSTDLSGEICDKYAENSPKIQVLHKKHGGLVSARKVGIAKAKGKYIGFIDGDDYIDEDMIQILEENLEKTGADFVHSGFWVKAQKVVRFENGVITFNGKKDRADFLKNYVLGSANKMVPSMWTKLFKTELIKKSYCAVPDTQEKGEDLINLTKCILQSKKVSLLDFAGYHYEIRQGSLMNSKGVEDLMWQLSLYLVIKDIMIEHACFEEVREELEFYCVDKVWVSLERRLKNPFLMTKYLFKDVDLIAGKKVVLYGAGRVGRDYYTQLSRYPDCEIVAWIDSNYRNINYVNCINVVGKECLNLLEYDYVIIAVKDREKAEEIKATLFEENVNQKKILYSIPIDVCYSEM